MLFSTNVLFFVLPALLAGVSVDASPITLGREIDVRATSGQKLLANGTGSVRRSGSVTPEFSWQATGILYQGCNSKNFPNISIKDCYEIDLSKDMKKNLDPGMTPARQRNEFLTKKAAAGTSHKYQWKYYLSSSTTTNNHFFHLMQLLTRGGHGGPVITLDAVADKVVIKDEEPSRACKSPKCPSIDLKDFAGKTTVHSVEVTYGDKGSFSYTITDGNKTLMKYSVKGNTGSDASVKFGAYRAAVEGMCEAHVAVGDFTSRS